MDNKIFEQLDSTTAPKRSSQLINPIGLIAAILAAIAMAIGLFSANIIDSLESRKVPDKHYATDDATVITDEAGNAITFVEQAIVFLARGLVCGTLATVALVLGCAALVRSPRIYGIIAVVLSWATFTVILGGN